MKVHSDAQTARARFKGVIFADQIMENLKTIIGVSFVFIGVGLFSSGQESISIKTIGGLLVVLGVIVLFAKRRTNTDDLGSGWHGGDLRNNQDDD